MLDRLINFYMTGNASSVLVMTKFWKVKPDLFKNVIVDLYTKEPTALTRILAFVHELKVIKHQKLRKSAFLVLTPSFFIDSPYDS